MALQSRTTATKASAVKAVKAVQKIWFTSKVDAPPTVEVPDRAGYTRIVARTTPGLRGATV